MTTEKIIALTIQTFVGKMMSLLFNELSRFVIAFLPRNECLLISWLHCHLQWFWNPRKWNQTLFPLFSSSICHKVMGLDAMIFVFWMLSFKPAFSLSSFIFIKRLFSSSSLFARVPNFLSSFSALVYHEARVSSFHDFLCISNVSFFETLPTPLELFPPSLFP